MIDARTQHARGGWRRIPRSGRAAVVVALAAALGPATAPPPAAAVDGTVDVRESRQTGRTDSGTFTSSLVRETLQVRQLHRWGKQLSLDGRFRVTRETTGSDAGGIELESERRSWQPDLTLAWRSDAVGLGARASWLERRNEGDTALDPEASRLQVGSWLDLRPDDASRLFATFTRTETDAQDILGDTRESRENSTFVTAERGFAETWWAEYRFTGLSSDLLDRDRKRTQRTHGLELRGTTDFGNDRLDAAFDAHTRYFTEDVEIGSNDVRAAYLAPLSATLTLDDTPATLDPLEDDPVSVPGLADQDRVDPTPVNLGDAAVPVREFGGDYRNLRYDFGETQDLASAVLYVDRRVPNPELFRWLVFVSDDPEGRQWDELSPAVATVTYREFGAFLQGWEVELAEGTTGRWFQMVDVKLGRTGPDLFVTELETFVREAGEVAGSTDRSRDHEVTARVDYEVSPTVRVGSRTIVGRRSFDDDARNLDEIGQELSSGWQAGWAALSARWSIHRVTGARGRNTDIRSTNLAARRRVSVSVTSTASWNRTDDRSRGRDRTDDTWSLLSRWQAAPRLHFIQQVSHGRRRDEDVAGVSRSWVLSHRVRATPWPTVSADLDRSDRWVDVEAGSGFQSFQDTELRLAWTPVPRVSLDGRARYVVRSSSEWIRTGTATWTPIYTRKFEASISGNVFDDTRSDVLRYGGGVSVIWRLRRGLLLEGDVQSSRFDVAGETSSPTSTFVRVNWNF